MTRPNGFILLNKTGEQFRLLSNEDAGLLIKALFDYAESGAIPDLPPAPKMAFSFIRAYMDENAEKYAQTVEKRRIAGKMGAAVTNGKRAANSASAENAAAKPPKSNKSVKLNENEKSNIKREDSTDKPRRPRFIAPEESDVLAYFAEQGSTNSEAASFYDYYTANGWTQGQGRGRPIKDWQAAARSWIRRAGQYTQRPSANSEASPLEIYRNL